MTRYDEPTKPILNVAIALATAAVFFADLQVPLGNAVWIFYLVPLSICLYVCSPRTPLLVAAAATLFIAVAFYADPPTPLRPFARYNRAYGIVITWFLAFVARQFILGRLTLAAREWQAAGLAQLRTQMQGDQPVPALTQKIVQFVCDYLGAQVGAVFVTQDDGSLRRVAGFALDGAAVPDTIKPGQGLLGQAVKEQRVFKVDDVPEGYLTVSSSLGNARPRHLIIAPAHADEAVDAVLELGFVQPTKPEYVELLGSLSRPIAIAIRASQYRTRLEELLLQTQQQAEELQTQQEELRVSNEELEEQGHTLRESQTRLEAQQAELEQTNSQLEEQRDELERAQTVLRQQAEDLARANQYKSEFLANMSHELRTPLNSSLILAKLLADNRDGNLTPEQVKFAETIYSAGNDLLALINDILDLSRIEAGRMELRRDTVALGPLVEALGRTFRPLAAEKQIAFTAQVEPSAPPAMTTDTQRLQQILTNLLGNAMKFTTRGEVSLRVSSATGGVAFAVRDSGIGIAKDQQEVIFEAFRQADGSTHRQYGGTGLGLTISRDLARRLGGDIRVESEPERGSTFTLVLPHELPAEAAVSPPPSPPPISRPPRAAAPPAPAAAAASPAAGAPPPAETGIEDDRDRLTPDARSILIIEDDLRFARIVADLAHELHFLCLMAASAGAGIELAARYRPSAVVLDMHLPDQSGLAVLEQLKHNGATRHIPVHVVSVADYSHQALEMGAVGYALKPLQRTQLVQAFQRLEVKLDQRLRRVLVVEDVEAQRASICALLRGEDIQITAVATGAEALRHLRDSTFDCMVLDLALPDMSGYQLLDQLAADDAFAFPPVIVYTGRSLTPDEEQQLRKYSSSIIIKGARSPERLLDEVTLFLHQVESKLPREQQRMLREARSRESVFEGRSILIAEDDVRNLFALSHVLEPKGAKVEIARNGREALAALERPGTPAIDLVLMDIMMPEMDGLTAIREIRKRPAWQKLPIIALTAKAMPDDRDKCLEAGANDYIAKPLDVERLLSLLRVWMPK